MASPWVASQQATHCKVKSFERAVLAECLEGILRASRREPACWRFERGDADLIESDQEHKWEDEYLLNYFADLLHLS